MKKFLKAGKKTLSVFLAVLMAFTALVFAAPENVGAVEAQLYEAADAAVNAADDVDCAAGVHDYVEGAYHSATCTLSGYTDMTCSFCGSTYKKYNESDPPKGHTWSAWTVTVQPTNTLEGEMTRSCTVEGCEATETAPVPKGEHEFDLENPVIKKQATCTEEGEVVYKCKIHVDAEGNNTCGVEIAVKTAKTPHSLSTSVSSLKCERIYNDDGTYEDKFEEGGVVVKCRICGHIDEGASFTIKFPTNPPQHEWTEWQVRTEPTCKSDGVRVRYCKRCSTEETQKITARPNHKFKATVVKPTCTDQGYTIYSCTGCDLVYRDDFVAVLGHDYDEGVAVEATCTTPGGIMYTCKRKNESEKIVDGEKQIIEVPCGHKKFVEDESKPAFGHKMGEWEFVKHPNKEADAYAKERICVNPGCTYSEYETGAGKDHEIDGVNAYYKVTFYNEWATAKYEVIETNRVYANPGDTPTFTQLADSYKKVELASIYVLRNTEAVYPLKTNPKREKDRNWGGYYFEGWTTPGEGPVDKDAVSSPLDISKITANTDLYALFKCRDVYYKVGFYNANGVALTKQTVILHGHSAEWPSSFVTPTLPDNPTWKYNFVGWAYDYTKIYDDVAIMAVYESVAKKYTVEYYDNSGVLLKSETVVNGQKLNAPEVTPKTYEDKKFVYIFTGKWMFANGDDSVNTEHFAVPSAAQEGDVIKIYAKYSKREKLYPVKLHVVDPYDASAPLEGVTVQIMDSKGQLAMTGETDENGDIFFSLTYDSRFTFTAKRGNYYTEGIMSFEDDVPGNAIKKMLGSNDYQGTIQLKVKEDPNAGKDCGCICHTFFGGMWITFLNILYRVFGVKHVCCYDMYAVHGDKLAYGKS